MVSEGVQGHSLWVKYRKLMINQLLCRELDIAAQQRILDAGPVTNAPGQYEYRPEVVAKVRGRLMSQAKEAR